MKFTARIENKMFVSIGTNYNFIIMHKINVIEQDVFVFCYERFFFL